MRISYWSSTCALPICDRVLASEAADAGDLGHAGRGGELVAQVPVLHGAQLVQRVAVALQAVLVDPAHARGIGSERRGTASRQLLRRGVHVFEHARASPGQVRAFLEGAGGELRTAGLRGGKEGG